MLPVSVHRLIYSLSPVFVRARLKERIPYGVNRFSLMLPDGQALQFDHLECSKILRRFAWKGIYGYEPDTIRLFYALAKGAVAVLDIGAYFGLYALIAAKANPQAVVHAFEPVPQNLQLLRHFLELNKSARVCVHAIAIAQNSGMATLYIPDQRQSVLPATGSLKNCFLPGERFADLSAQTLKVETIPLDSVVEEFGLKTVDLVKIDTEETEYDVILSGLKTLARYRPDIVMEIIFGNQQVTDALAELRHLGYRFFSIGPNGLGSLDKFHSEHRHAIETRDIIHCEILCTCRSDSAMPRY